MQTLTDQLTTAVAPHSSPEATTNRTLKGVAKTLKHLAKQLTKQHAKQEAAAQKAATPTGKKQRKALTLELLKTLRPFLGSADDTGGKVSKPIGKTVQHLSAQLIEQRRKQAKQVAKASRKSAKREEKAEAPVLKVVRLASAVTSKPASRRAPTKRMAPPTASAAIKKELAAAPAA